MKKYTSITLSMIFVIGLSNCLFSREDQQKKNGPFSEVGSFFDKFDTWMYGDEQTKGISEKTKDFFKQAEKEVKGMMHELKKTSRHLHDRSLHHAKQAFEQTSKLMKEGALKLEELKKNISDDIEKTQQAKQYNVREYTNNDKNTYGVEIILPHIKKDAIKVNTTETKKKSGIIKSLEITAEEEINADNHIQKLYSRQMYSSSVINGKTKETRYKIKYENGTVTIIINLPDNIDEENYTMKFDDEKLTIEFEKTKKERTTRRKLMFTR